MSSMKTEIIKITPSMAREWLNHNKWNRTLRPNWIDQLTAMIQRGEWSVTNDAICFGEDGNLMNGQHRLTAIERSEITVDALVLYGVSKEAFMVMDQGKKRTISDATQIPKKVSESLRLAALWLNNGTPSIKQVDELGQTRLRDILDRLIDRTRSTRRYFSTAPVKLAAAIAILGDYTDEEDVHRIYASMVNFDTMSMTPATHALVRQVENNSANSSDQRDTFARAFRVFRANNEKFTRIQMSDADIDSAVTQAKMVIRNMIDEGLIQGSLFVS